ncbi:MAG: hypothetical protein HYX90_09145 [Chloroflexi bacterium]|nr:hypothetical protein [Chloroflexota bacterium]
MKVVEFGYQKDFLLAEGIVNQVTESSEKTSAKIVDVAQPWVQRLGPDPPLAAMQAVHVFAMTLWNARRVPHEGKAESGMKQLRRWLLESLSDLPQEEVHSLMARMLNRAARYDNDWRMVLNVQVERLPEGRFNVNAVGATFSNGERK